MTGLLWYLAETGAALAVFYAVYRLAAEERHPFPDGPALPARIAGRPLTCCRSST